MVRKIWTLFLPAKLSDCCNCPFFRPRCFRAGQLLIFIPAISGRHLRLVLAATTLRLVILEPTKAAGGKRIEPQANGKVIQELQLTICDLRDDCVDSAVKRFAGVKSVLIRKVDITKLSVEAFATAGNSFGDMGGGVDRAIDNFYSERAQPAVQEAVRAKFFGELPVGSAVTVAPLPRKPLLIYAPTMRVPGRIQGTINAYLAMRAILIAALGAEIRSLACPMLGTGVGGLPTDDAADQMFQAYRLIVLGEHKSVLHSLQAPFPLR